MLNQVYVEFPLSFTHQSIAAKTTRKEIISVSTEPDRNSR
jgi:hypothetical protein